MDLIHIYHIPNTCYCSTKYIFPPLMDGVIPRKKKKKSKNMRIYKLQDISHRA